MHCHSILWALEDFSGTPPLPMTQHVIENTYDGRLGMAHNKAVSKWDGLLFKKERRFLDATVWNLFAKPAD